jgi:hypothetical protein
MNHCYVEFTPLSAETLQRTEAILALIGDMKREVQDVDEERISELLTPAEKAFFWDPEPLELEEWNQHWKATPVDVRLSPAMVIPQWTLGSMYEAFWEGDYEFIGILAEDGKHFLAFRAIRLPLRGHLQHDRLSRVLWAPRTRVRRRNGPCLVHTARDMEVQAPFTLRPNPSVKWTPRKRDAPYVER